MLLILTLGMSSNVNLNYHSGFRDGVRFYKTFFRFLQISFLERILYSSIREARWLAQLVPMWMIKLDLSSLLHSSLSVISRFWIARNHLHSLAVLLPRPLSLINTRFGTKSSDTGKAEKSTSKLKGKATALYKEDPNKLWGIFSWPVSVSLYS